MYNKVLEYLLSNESENVLSKKGVQRRRKINPLLLKLIPLATKNKLKVVTKGIIPQNRKIIYSGTHGFHDDILFSFKTINKHVYLLYGSLLDFYHSIHGIILWLIGVILVDRKNKLSRKSSINKMTLATRYGVDILMFPEATWNKHGNLPVQKLYPGIYDVAEKSKALVVPLATVLYEKTCYSSLGNAYDITNMNQQLLLEVVASIINRINKIIDILIYGNHGEIRIKNILLVLAGILSNEVEIETLKNIDNIDEYKTSFLNILNTIKDQDENSLEKRIEELKNISVILIHAAKEIRETMEDDSIEKSIMDRTIYTLKIIRDQKKLIAVNDLRDKMSTLAWEMYKGGRREDFDDSYWDEIIKREIASTKGLYDHEIEDVAEYKYPDLYDIDDVFAALNNVKRTPQNIKALGMPKKLTKKKL